MLSESERAGVMTERSTPENADARLVEATRDDPRAFVALYERYLGRVYRYCLVRLPSVAMAEDATSEAFLKALDRLPGYRGGSFAAWLFAIVRNVVTDHYRRRPSAPLEAALDMAGGSSLESHAFAVDRRRAL